VSFRIIFITLLIIAFLGQVQASFITQPCDDNSNHEYAQQSEVNEAHTDNDEDECCDIDCCKANCPCSESLCSAAMYLVVNHHSVNKRLNGELSYPQQLAHPSAITDHFYRPPIYTS